MPSTPKLIQPDPGGSCCGCNPGCGPCCTVTFATRSVSFAKCGYNAQNPPSLAGIVQPPPGAVSASCDQSTVPRDAFPRWYHRQYYCWAPWYDGVQCGLGPFLAQEVTRGYAYPGDGCYPCSWDGSNPGPGVPGYFTCTTAGEGDGGFSLPGNSTIDPLTCVETQNNYSTIGGGLEVVCYACYDAECSDCLTYANNLVLTACNNYPIIPGASGPMAQPFPLYFDEPYSDSEAVGHARARIDAEGWAACTESCMASIAFDAGGGIDHTDVYITDLDYTVTPATKGGACYWTVRYTAPGGAITDTAMSGSSTYTITPGEGSYALTYDGNNNYSSGAGTWQIINLSGTAP